MLVCLFSVTKYHFRYDEQKKFMELENVNFQLAVDAGKINKMFSGLNWITTHFSQNPEQEINSANIPGNSPSFRNAHHFHELYPPTQTNFVEGYFTNKFTNSLFHSFSFI